VKPTDFSRTLLWAGTLKIDKLGRVYIPVRARGPLGLKPGDQVDVFYDTANNALIMRAARLRGVEEAA